MLLAVLPAPMAVPPAAGAERRFSVTSFERIRVEGPFEVRLDTGKPPSASVVADQRTLDQMSFTVDGTTLVVRLSGSGWGETPRQRRTAPVITLTTHELRSALVRAGARLTVTGIAGQRVDLAVNGSGVLIAEQVRADQLNATVIGAGGMTLSGTAQRAQLMSNGAGTIDAAKLIANDLVVRQDGTGETLGSARFTAKVTTNGLGRVAVGGTPACTVKALAGGPVSCGTP